MAKFIYGLLLIIMITGCTSEEGETVKADVTGVITEINKETNQILVINEQSGQNTSESEATWIGLSEDGKIFVDGTSTNNTFDQSLVGREAEVWTTGFIGQSNPRKASALKVLVK